MLDFFSSLLSFFSPHISIPAAVVWILIRSGHRGICFGLQTRALVQSHRLTMGKCAGNVYLIKKVFKKSLPYLIPPTAWCVSFSFFDQLHCIQLILFRVLASSVCVYVCCVCVCVCVCECVCECVCMCVCV